jgi:hypothetical protein
MDWSNARVGGIKTWFAGLVDKPQSKPTIVRGGPSNAPPTNTPSTISGVQPKPNPQPTPPPVTKTPEPAPSVAAAVANAVAKVPTPPPTPAPTSAPAPVAPAPALPKPTVQVDVMPKQREPIRATPIEVSLNPPANPAPPPEAKKPDPKPEPTPAPVVSDEQAANQARDLWWKALDAEQRNDYKEAVKLYEQIKALPATVHPGLLDTYLTEAKKNVK